VLEANKNLSLQIVSCCKYYNYTNFPLIVLKYNLFIKISKYILLLNSNFKLVIWRYLLKTPPARAKASYTQNFVFYPRLFFLENPLLTTAERKETKESLLA